MHHDVADVILPPAALLRLVNRAQVDDRVQSEVAEELRVGVGQRVRTVGAEQPPPLHGSAVERLVAAEVAEVERALEGEVAQGVRGSLRRVFDR